MDRTASKSVISCKEPYGREPSSSSAAAAAASLLLSGGSHGIAKRQQRPKVRIVHIVAPKIIKIEAHNFRALVQRLTGKPKKAAGRKNNQKLINNDDDNSNKNNNDDDDDDDDNKQTQMQQEKATTCGLSPPWPGPGPEWEEMIKTESWVEGERETTTTASSSGSHGSIINSSGGFGLDGLGDLGLGFLHGLCDLPWPPLILPMASSDRTCDSRSRTCLTRQPN